MSVPVIDVAPLVRGDDASAVARAIDAACRDIGFFSIVGHGVDPELCAALNDQAREFFALAEEEKARIAMQHGGRAWRGWFPVGGELTAGIPDQKEGIYFGAEEVAATMPLHGPNLFPKRPAGLRTTVLAYLDALTELGHALMRAFTLVPPELTTDPTILFRIFHYPPADDWGVREHTDYGLLTILLQDATGGLQVKSTRGWIDVAPQPNAFVCNIGDMLERISAGRYRSTAHRVRNTSREGRLSFPFFFDPGWNADIGGTIYRDYLLMKVARVFPMLGEEVL